MQLHEALRRDALEFLGKDAKTKAGYEKLEEALDLFRTIYAKCEEASKLFDHDSQLYAQTRYIQTIADEAGEALSKVQWSHS